MKTKVLIPSHLEKLEADLYTRLQSEYGIQDSAGVALLTLACESVQLVRHCRERISDEGQLTDHGRAHPLFAVMRDARTSFLHCIRQLGLDIEGAGEIGAPIGNNNAAKKRVR